MEAPAARLKQRLSLLAISSAVFVFLSCGDAFLEPEEQFVRIHFRYGFRDELNTFENYFRKDLVRDGVMEIDFWLTRNEQSEILHRAESLGFFTMPDSIIVEAPVVVAPNPLQSLRIQSNGSDNTVVWHYIVEEFRGDLADHFESIQELSRTIREIIELKPEYTSLPPRSGGYD